jgi:hypothetical protein
MNSLRHIIYSTIWPFENEAPFDHFSIEIPTATNEDFDRIELFDINPYHHTIHLLAHGHEEPSICIRGLAVIIKLFRTKTAAAIRQDCNFHDSIFDSLFRTVTEVLDYRKSIVDEVAQNDEYIKAFDRLIPEKLRGFELIWRNVFDYHRSIAEENRMICRLGCEALFLILECLVDDRGRNHQGPEKMLMKKISQSTYMLALSSIMGSMLKYGEDDDIMSYGAGGICIIVSCLSKTYLHVDEDEVMTIDHDQYVMYFDQGTLKTFVGKGKLMLVLESLNVVTKAVRNHIGSISFITDFCRVIDSIDCDSVLYGDMTHPTLSLCELFVDVLREYQEDPTVTYLTLKIIEKLLKTLLTNAKDRFSLAVVMDTIVLAINLHILHSTVVFAACRVMLLLADYSPSNRILLGSAGACEAVEKAFSKYSSTFKREGKCRPLVRALAYGNTENTNRLLYLGLGDWVPQLNIGGWLDGDEIEQGGDY